MHNVLYSHAELISIPASNTFTEENLSKLMALDNTERYWQISRKTELEPNSAQHSRYEMFSIQIPIFAIMNWYQHVIHYWMIQFYQKLQNYLCKTFHSNWAPACGKKSKIGQLEHFSLYTAMFAYWSPGRCRIWIWEVVSSPSARTPGSLDSDSLEALEW